MIIPLSQPDIGEREIEYVTQVLRSNQLSLGPMLTRFEEQFAGYVGTKYAVASNSGTSALHMAVRALGIGAGHEVITSSFSFVASVNCLLYEGALPRFVDIHPRNFNIDPELIRDFLRHKCIRNRQGEVIDRDNGLMVKAILPVHVFGVPADMGSLQEIAQEYGLQLLEDACEAIGAEYRGKRVGTFGAAAVFAFYPNKQMTTGEGGMIVTDDARIAEECRSLRNQGRDSDGRWLSHVRLGYNYRLSDILCAVGCGQLERIDELLNDRSRVAQRYIELLQQAEDSLRIPQANNDAKRSWFVFVVQMNGSSGSEARENVRARLKDAGIATQAYFPPIHQQPYFQGIISDKTLELPITEHAGETCLALPFFSKMSDTEIELVVSNLIDALKEESSHLSHVTAAGR